MPRYSILLPTHNRDDVVGFAIESALAQSEADFELLVAGDGCTDRTAEVVAGFRDPRLRWFDLPKAPSFGYANRNIALREARGELIAYLAHDDLWFPDHLQLLGDAIERAGAEWIYSLPLWASPDGLIVPACGNLNNPDELDAFLTLANFIPSPCVVHRRACLDRYGYWPEDGDGADWRNWVRMIEGGGRQSFGYLPTPTVLHFKAIWRKTRDSGRPEVEAALAIADEASWWPASLKFAVPAGCSEQSVVWSALRGDGTGGPAAIRAGVARVIGRLARDATEVQLPRIAALEAAWLAASAERDGLQAAWLSECAEKTALRTALLAESAEKAARQAAWLVASTEKAALEAARITESAERSALQAAWFAERAERTALQAALLAASAEKAALQAALDDARNQLDRLAHEGLLTSAGRRLRNRLRAR